MERQRDDQRADGPFPSVIGGEMGEVAEGAPARLQASEHQPRQPRARNGDVDAKLARGNRLRDRDALE